MTSTVEASGLLYNDESLVFLCRFVLFVLIYESETFKYIEEKTKRRKTPCQPTTN